MKTITAKELRDNLDSVVQRVRGGETVKVTYRSKPAFTLTPDANNDRLRPGSQAATNYVLQKLQSRQALPRQPVFDPKKSVKELYHDLLNDDQKHT